MKKIQMLPLLIFVCFFFFPGSLAAFSFSEHGQEEARQTEKTQKSLDELTSVPCKKALKDKKIALIIGEQHSDGSYGVRQSRYGNLFQIINRKLRNLGLTTYTRQEITEQIAKAEMEAFLANNIDAATSASTRLAADFILRGLISTRIQKNPVIGIQEIFVTMSFTLVESTGRTISDVKIDGESFSGADTLSTVLDLVREKANMVVAELYNDYCSPVSP
ncbi:MAG: hypothetical protein KAJ60_10255 [Desulfobulbaceae bacterium]|nr:hypothetical protein [Desulfobulbaceae bacterium]